MELVSLMAFSKSFTQTSPSGLPHNPVNGCNAWFLRSKFVLWFHTLCFPAISLIFYCSRPWGSRSLSLSLSISTLPPLSSLHFSPHPPSPVSLLFHLSTFLSMYLSIYLTPHECGSFPRVYSCHSFRGVSTPQASRPSQRPRCHPRCPLVLCQLYRCHAITLSQVSPLSRP